MRWTMQLDSPYLELGWIFYDFSKTSATTEISEAAACLKPNLKLSTLTEETKKIDFTKKGATEKYLCIFQVKRIFKTTNKAKPKLNPLTTFSGTKPSLQPFLD